MRSTKRLGPRKRTCRGNEVGPFLGSINRPSLAERAVHHYW